MSERADTVYLSDILEAARRIATYVSGLTYTKTQDAVIRNLGIIDKATKKISSEFRATHPDIPWRSMAGVRDRLIHDYFGMNLEIVWQLAAVDLPDIASRIQALLDGEV